MNTEEAYNEYKEQQMKVERKKRKELGEEMEVNKKENQRRRIKMESF